jgi:anti-sigma factor ChrR (cupin superfamily)
MSTTLSKAEELLPTIVEFLADARGVVQSPDFQPLTTDGRVGVEVHMLYSTRAETPDGPAAAVVRYLPGARAVPHVHPGYELIYVLSGELETDEGVYPPNTLLTMHPGTVHAPRTTHGCTVIVVWEKPVQPLTP